MTTQDNIPLFKGFGATAPQCTNSCDDVMTQQGKRALRRIEFGGGQLNIFSCFLISSAPINSAVIDFQITTPEIQNRLKNSQIKILVCQGR